MVRACGETAHRKKIDLRFFLLLAFLVSPAAAEVQLPELNPAEPIAITAEAGNRWQLGAYEVWVLRGNCTIQQGQGFARPRGRLVDRPCPGWRHAAE